MQIEKNYGDRFERWCKGKGRQLPSTKMVELLNSDPQMGLRAVRQDSDNPLVYRSIVTFMTMGMYQNV